MNAPSPTGQGPALDAVAAALEAVADGLTVDGAPAAELVALSDRVGRVRRLADAVQARIAGEIARQSRPELGKDSLARREGFRSPQTMIATTTGVSVPEAQRIIQVAEATAPRRNLVGERLPAKHPHVGAAVGAGRLGMSVASAIVTMLDRVAVRAGAERVERMEKALVEAAPGLTPDQVNKVILQAQAYLDPDGQEPRDAANRDARSLVIREEPDGMITIIAKLDAASAAPVKTALEGIVTGQFRRGMAAGNGAVDAGGGAAGADAPVGASADMDADATAGRAEDEAMADRRPLRQRLADALVALCTHALGCEEVPTGVTTTVVVRMNRDDLETGTGIAQIDGLAVPVSAATARRMAADAGVIPCVLGGESEILDWGRTKRLFTPAQKLALVERDGGCAFCGAPPGQTIVHHILWWARDGGATDLSNGVLLCTACHHRVHDDGWDIRVDGRGTTAAVWFTPPSWLDRSQTPRRGGDARYSLAA